MNCVYDNPVTMAREMWQDGKLLAHTQARLLLDANFKGFPSWPFPMNCGEWNSGAIRGDAEAIGVSVTKS